MDNIKPLLQQIEKETNSLHNQILYLETENKLLRDSAYKDLELSRMKEERDEARRLLYQGFAIEDSEKRRIDEWIQQHKEKHNGKYSSCYNYIFTPTGVGVAGKVQCGNCKEEYEFSDFNNW